jgi:hypothetical protein
VAGVYPGFLGVGGDSDGVYRRQRHIQLDDNFDAFYDDLHYGYPDREFNRDMYNSIDR